jgi:hypothetical protein
MIVDVDESVAQDRSLPDFDVIAGVVRGLLIELESSTSAENAELVSEFLDHAEYGLAVDQLADEVRQRGVVLRADQRDRFAGVALKMGMPDPFPR